MPGTSHVSAAMQKARVEKSVVSNPQIERFFKQIMAAQSTMSKWDTNCYLIARVVHIDVFVKVSVGRAGSRAANVVRLRWTTAHLYQTFKLIL